MYYSIIGVLAILVLFMVNRDILANRKISLRRPVWKMYRRFLLTVLAYYTTDVIWGILEYFKLPGLLFADTTLYYVAMAAGVLYWAAYTVAYLEDKSRFGRGLMITGNIMAAAITVLSVVNIFIPVLFTVNSDSVYTALPGRHVMLACQIVFLLTISLYALSSMYRLQEQNERRRRYRILSAFGMIMALFLFLQYWFPYMPLYTIAYMLSTCMLHTFVANEEQEDYRREREEAQRVTELKNVFFSLLNNMPGLAFTKDAETGVYITCNQAFAEYAHKENPDAVAGLTDAEIFDPETAEHFVKDDRIALSISKPYIFFEDVPDAAGNHRQLQTTKLKYTDTGGRLCLLGLCQDVTDLVRIQHENAMTKEAYETAVSSGLMYTHIAQTLARDYSDLYSVNADTEEYIEYSRDEQGKGLSEKRRGWHFFSDCVSEMASGVYADDRESFRRAMTRKTLMKALGVKNTFIMTYRQISGDSTIYVNLKASRMENDEQFIIIGITNVDAEMRDTMAKSEVLAEALNAAKEADKARSAFLSSMSHEIRTPMNAIIGLDTLALKKGNLDGETRGYLEKIGGSARHLLTIINDILDMSRIESGHVALRKEAFSLAALLEQVCAPVKAQCEEKGLTFECRKLNETGDAYIGDETRIREALNNILSNAVKFTEAPGCVTLTVEKTAAFEEQSTLRFRVKDTGIGMEESFIPHIFDAFSREDGSNRNRFSGTGLGMAITRQIVEIMNGTVSVKSEKGKGTEVTVAVTLKDGSAEDTAAGSMIDPAKLSVLIVDDDPVEAEHAKSVLDDVGIRADSCSNGHEALERLREAHGKRRPYNLILMDWNMPGMDGLETSEEIRRQFGDESAIVVLTAYSWDDIRDEAHKVGVDHFLAKPLFASNVMEQIRQIARQADRPLLRESKRADLKGRRILLAEDLQSNAEIMTDILEMENIRTDHASNGKIATDLFAKSDPGTYSAILMDIRMPEMDGLEAAAAIRAMNREDAKRIPIIALTANAFDEDVQRSMQAGMNAHLSKPVDSDQLVRVLGELIWQAEEQQQVNK